MRKGQCRADKFPENRHRPSGKKATAFLCCRSASRHGRQECEGVSTLQHFTGSLSLELYTHHARDRDPARSDAGLPVGRSPAAHIGHILLDPRGKREPTHFFTGGLVRARTPSMKSSTARLRDRFFRVMTATSSRVLGNSTGKILSDGCLCGSLTQ